MNKNVGRAMSLLREMKGLTQAALAKEAGCGKAQISRYETGGALPMLVVLERVLTVLGVSSVDFFYTVRLIDRLQEGLEKGLSDAELLSSRIGMTEVPLDRAFRALLDDFFTLHQTVFEQELRRILPAAAIQELRKRAEPELSAAPPDPDGR